MSPSDWISLAVAIGTISLAFMAWKTIRQARSIRETDRRRELLGSILDWAIDVSECCRKINVPRDTRLLEIETYEQLEQTDAIKCFNVVNTRSEYVSSIALTFDKDLRSAVESIVQKLDEFVAVRWNIFDPKDIDKFLSEYEVELHNRAENLIKEVCKIATRIKG